MSRNIRATSWPWTTVSALAFALATLFASVNTAHAQPSRFSIDLREVGKLYDTRYRDRVTEEVTDSLIVYDYKSVPFGNLRYRVPHFLTTDTDTTHKVVDYLAIPGYRTVVTVPNTAFFEPLERQSGEFVLVEPRDYTIPGLEFDIRPVDEAADELSVAGRRQLWRESVRARVSALSETGTEATTGGIKFEIPLPMPKQLESIFGPGEKTSITLRGREEITIAGETSVVDPFIGAEGRQSQSLFPSLDMQQKLDVSLTGTIGDKVSIQVDHSSEAVTEDANRVRLAYTGYEDEVIQLIELGNTSLSLPGSQLVSVSTNAQGLFGAKMLAKMGSTDITVIASKQEGEVSSAQFSPSAGTLGQTEVREIRDVDYIHNKYFYFNDALRRGDATLLPDESKPIQVWRQVAPTDPPDTSRRRGWAIPDTTGNGGDIRRVVTILNANGQPQNVIEDNFHLLEFGVDYNFIIDANTEDVLGVELSEAIPDNALKSLGVMYTTESGQLVGGTYASLGVLVNGQPVVPNGADDRLLLKMLKAPDPDPNGIFASTWDLEIRNIYNMGLTDIDGSSLKVEIIDNLNSRLNPEYPDSSNVKYLRIFGLDRTDRSGTGPPDNAIDLTLGRVNLDSGLLIFESITPFHPTPQEVASYLAETDEFSFDDPLYKTQYDKSARIYAEKLNSLEEEQVHQYTIRVEAVSTSKTFRINALNIVEESERITVDGQALIRGTDYEIDYITGEVTLKDAGLAKLNPDSKINIDYQFKPLGGVGSSTLAGFSSASNFGENTRFGTTFLYESRASTQDRARLGEEPSRAFVGGVTGSYQHQSRILTDIANWLPYVDTDQPSTLNLDGEIAGSMPNPNTKHEAYIDDFEGVEDTDRIGLARRSWYPASIPLDSNNVEKPATSRAKFFWYNIEPEFGLHRRDLNPTLDEQENTLLQSLDMELEAPAPLGNDTTYAGVMLGFQGGGLDISQGQFLEIWVNDFKPDPFTRGGKLHIDLGIIDENYFEPEVAPAEFNDEDRNRDGFAAGLDDSGLDGLFNDASENPLGAPEPSLPGGTPEDPSGDDIDLSRINGRFTHVNGTEGNLVYDTEDLDRNGQLGRVNAYFSYEIDLADSAEIDIRRQYPGYDGFTKPAHVNDSWRMYRVKLTDFRVHATSAVQPRLDEIRHVRIWFDALEDVVRSDGVGRQRLQVAEFSIEGNRWEVDGVRNLNDDLVADSLATEFAIGVISTKTDPGVYRPPVVPNKQNEISDKESSLALRYTNLQDTTQVRILKRFVGAGLNMTLYRELNFWVHTDQLRPNMEYYFRMGTNETNYYEIAVPFSPEYYNETGWARVVVDLSDLTNLKFLPAADVIDSVFAEDVAEPGKRYPIRLRGVPNLNGVRFLYAGVRNRNIGGGPQSGEIWINDIFVGDVMRDFDHAERLSANLAIAGGAISVGGNWARTGADYRGLRQTRGAGADQTILGVNAKTDVQYFIPLFGFSLPVAANYSKTKSLPKFPPNSDTEITDPFLSDSLKTVRWARGFNFSLSRRNPSTNFFMRYTLDRLRPTFSYTDQHGSSPAFRDTTTSMQAGVTYQMTWSSGNTLPLFGRNRFRWWINQIDLSSQLTRQTGKRWTYINGQFQRDPDQYNSILRNQGTVRYNPFRSLETSFGGAVTQDRAIDNDWMGYNVGTEIARSNNVRVSFVSPDWRILNLFEKPSVEVQSNYSEDSGPNVRREGDPGGTRNVSASRNDSGRIGFDIGKQFGRLFKVFGWEVDTPVQSPRGGSTGGGSPGGLPGGAGMPPDSSGVLGGAQVPPDTTRAGQQAAAPKPTAGSFLKGVGRMFTTIRPLKANVQHRKSSSYLRVPERPDWSYQFGLDNNTGITITDSTGTYGIGPPDNKQSNLSYNVESGVQLRENLDVQGRYTQAITDTDFRANASRSTSTTWPDLQGRWGGLERLRVLDQSIQQGELRVDWRETKVATGPKELPPVTTTETFTLTPALVLVWKNQLNSSLNMSYNTNTNDTQGSRSVTSNTTVGVELKKTFRGGGALKIFGKGIDWRNEMEATLQMAYARTGGERFQPGSTISEPIPRTTTLSVDPLVRYTFSKNISGSAFVGYGRSFTEQTGQTTTTVRLGVTAVINF